MSYNDRSDEPTQGRHLERYPFFKFMEGASNLTSEYVHFYISSISKLLSIRTDLANKQKDKQKKKKNSMMMTSSLGPVRLSMIG
ncbi:MAG: hypothetical protein ACJ70T_06405 [Nitrososphaera sp.]